jgi:hypothetical protein
MASAEMAAAASDMAAVLEREPHLSDFGFGVFDPRSKTPAERAAELRLNRDRIREPRSLARFMAARRWLSRFGKIKAVNKRGSSYGLKHVAEHHMGYVTNGVFIAAASAEGFAVQRADGGPNAWFNISTKAWR